jgi:integrase
MPEANTGRGSPGSVSGNWGSLGRKSVLSGWVSGAITTETPRGSVRVVRCPDTVNLQELDGREDMKVWLADQEIKQLLEVASDVDVEHYLAIGLGVRCGLRSAEVLDVTPRYIQDTTAGRMLRVQDGKGEKYRETTVPTELATTLSTVADVREASTSEPLLDVTTRTLRRWVDAAALELV